MNKQHFLVHPFKLAVSLATALTAAVLGFSLIAIRPVSAAVFFAISLLFLLVALSAGAMISVEPEGVRRQVLGKTTKFLSWEEIAEIGVAGSRIFAKSKKDKTGTLYIYLSERILTDEDRFQMMLNWPPKNQIYLQHTKARLDALQLHWSKKIQSYNAGNLKF